MLCPYCNHDNVEGDDLCASCGQDLTTAGVDSLEVGILEATLDRLGPKAAVVLAPDTSIAETVAKLNEHSIGCVLIGSTSELAGIFSERDLVLRIGERYEEVRDHPVSEFMTREPEVFEENTPVAFVMNRMAVRDFRHLPVVRGGKLTGVVSMRDVLTHVCQSHPDLLGG